MPKQQYIEKQAVCSKRYDWLSAGVGVACRCGHVHTCRSVFRLQIIRITAGPVRLTLALWTRLIHQNHRELQRNQVLLRPTGFCCPLQVRLALSCTVSAPICEQTGPDPDLQNFGMTRQNQKNLDSIKWSRGTKERIRKGRTETRKH